MKRVSCFTASPKGEYQDTRLGANLHDDGYEKVAARVDSRAGERGKPMELFTGHQPSTTKAIVNKGGEVLGGL